ncbi:MAG: chromosome segregation protein SMC [Chloroflexia bacterium]
MRLKTLNLQGFKTFAPKTAMVFGEGLSAVVGPNGSGKSNIADGIRWVLGEQSLSHLRAKKTEDLIFAGSSNRAPLGMAEVSITLDNSDRLLPLDFSEVTLTRRAYRSGENEYYINMSRVRLRDITELASTLGQAYTVVGQGLVDAALSLRPEERRELFEEAATIRGYFVQREDALKRLSKTEENIARVNDLAVEQEPQVRRLERQAKQAQEYGKLETELHALLRDWFRGRWRVASDGLKMAIKAEDMAVAAVETRKAEANEMTACVLEARAALRSHLDKVSGIHEQRAQVQSRHATFSQSLAVLTERVQSAGTRREAVMREQAELQNNASKLQTQLASLDGEWRERSAELAGLRDTGEVVTSRLAALDAEVRELHGRRDALATEIRDFTNKQNGILNRLELARRQKAEQEEVISTGARHIAEADENLVLQMKLLGELLASTAKVESVVAEAEKEYATARTSLEAARTSLSDVEVRRRDLGKQIDTLTSQLAALSGEQQSGLYSGVRAVVSAVASKQLEGYIGTVAELLRVPNNLETAIEAALGGRLQEVVMSRWADAEKAIAMLKAKGAGRATFLPLDTLRTGSAPSPPVGPGIIGLARDLVEYDPLLRVLGESLLGRLLVVEDLPSARKTISSFGVNAPWTLATLGGEVVRPGGSVTGGSNLRQDDSRAKGRTILSLERRKREMTDNRESLVEEAHKAEQSLEERLEVVRSRESQVKQAAARVDDGRGKVSAARLAHLEQEGTVSRVKQEKAWRSGLLSEAHSKIESLSLLDEKLTSESQDLGGKSGLVRQQLVDVEAEVERTEKERELVARSAGDDRIKLAVVSEGLRNFEARRADLRAQADQVERRLSTLQARLSEAGGGEKALLAQVEEQRRQVEELAAQLHDIESRVAPSEQESQVLEQAVAKTEEAQSVVQSSLLDCETAHSRASVERQRCIDVLGSLRREIEEELEREGEQILHTEREPTGAEMLTPPSGLVGPAGEDASRGSPTVNAERERRVYALKGRLSRLGPVNPLAVEEHTALSERHAYLREQLTDLTGAAESLRRVISELDRAMREQFAATFVQVNDAFQYFFKTLFAGGTAQLELTNPHDIASSGVEISAQPPGKRMQPLAALSGGERALTSAALLFALLKVRPVPFCVLDEVDAALDESNVTRFRDALQELGKQTQFVLITHNRGTIEAADTLYGVSMAGDGTSQLLSLKVGA